MAEQGEDLRAVGDRIQSLIDEFGELSDPQAAKQQAEELVRLLMRLYGGGLRRMLEIIDEAQGESSKFVELLAADDLLSSLLILHDLHPLGLEERIAAALDRVRPYLGSHGGDVTFLGLDEGVVRLRLEGSCDGCPSSAATLKYAVEGAIEAAAPEVTGIEVEGVEALREARSDPGSAVVQIGDNDKPSNGASEAEPAWIRLEQRPGLEPGALTSLEVGGLQVMMCRLADDLYAYRDACPGCESSLATASLEGRVLTCTSCDSRFDVQLAGRPADSGTAHLEPLPLLTERDQVMLAIPVPAGS